MSIERRDTRVIEVIFDVYPWQQDAFNLGQTVEVCLESSVTAQQ